MQMCDRARGGGDLVSRRYDGVVEAYRHGAPPGDVLGVQTLWRSRLGYVHVCYPSRLCKVYTRCGPPGPAETWSKACRAGLVALWGGDVLEGATHVPTRVPRPRCQPAGSVPTCGHRQRRTG